MEKFTYQAEDEDAKLSGKLKSEKKVSIEPVRMASPCLPLNSNIFW